MGQLTMILVLVNPTISFIGFHHKFIVAKASIYECIDKGASQVTAR